MSKYRGFTLLEVMIVVGIVAILAAIAIPNYNNYIVRSKISEATSQLSTMRIKMEQFFQDNRFYTGACQPLTVAPLPTGENAKYFSYSCAIPDANNYVVTANGVVGQGMTGFSYTIDQAGNRRTVTTGWGTCANTACWAIRQDCSC
jgi:type IV pilus assembly protein PilE